MNSSRIQILPRNHIIDTLAEATVTRALTVVTAPVGYGKTIIANCLAEAIRDRAYLVTVPPNRRKSGHLWTSICGQLEQQGFDLAQAISDIGFPDTPTLLERVFIQLDKTLTPSCLIIDDYQHFNNPGMDAFVEACARAQLKNFSICLLSRTRPEMKLEEFRLKGMAAVFEHSLLAFSEEEAEDYFTLHGVAHGIASRAAWKYSEGWPAVLWMCLQSWKKNGKLCPKRDIDALLAETVFSSFDRDDQSFLMCISMLDRFSPDEAVSLSDDLQAGRRLRRLQNVNALLNYDASTDRYHFHGIFRDFLNREFMAANHLDKAEILHRAGECYASRGDLLSAFRLFMKAGREVSRLRAIELFLFPGGNRILTGSQDEVRSAMLSMPLAVRLKEPLGYLAFIFHCIVETGDLYAVSLLEEVEEYVQSDENIQPIFKKHLQGEIKLIRAFLAFNDLPVMQEFFHEARQLIGGQSTIFSRHQAWTFHSPHVSFLYVHGPGQYRETLDLIEREWPLCGNFNGCGHIGARLLLRAEHLLERGEFQRVENLLLESSMRAESAGQQEILLAAHFCLARLKAIGGETDEAGQLLEAMIPPAEGNGSTNLIESFDLSLGYIHGSLGQYKQIPQWIRDGNIFERPHLPPQLAVFTHVVYGKALVAEGDFVRLEALAKGMPMQFTRYDSLFGKIHAKVLEAIATRHMTDPEAALSAMWEAVELSRQDGIVLSIAEYGNAIMSLLRRMSMETHEDPHLKKVLALTERMSRLTAGTGRKKKGLLTTREEEIMRLVIKGRSNPDIAKQLGIAEITVKKILSSAYARLGAGNRVEAARVFDRTYLRRSKI